MGKRPSRQGEPFSACKMIARRYGAKTGSTIKRGRIMPSTRTELKQRIQITWASDGLGSPRNIRSTPEMKRQKPIGVNVDCSPGSLRINTM